MESHKNSMFQTTNQSLYVGFAWGFAWVHPHHGGTSSGHQGSKKDTDFPEFHYSFGIFLEKKNLGGVHFWRMRRETNDWLW